MAEYKIYFDIAGEFGAQISFEAKAGVSYEGAAAAIDKGKLAEALCLSVLGYSAEDIAVITPEQYEAEYGGDDVAPVVHARWGAGRYNPETRSHEELCTRCRKFSKEYGKPYCPNCGAKMNGGDEGWQSVTRKSWER